jgi:uncharacterized membrane protein
MSMAVNMPIKQVFPEVSHPAILFRTFEWFYTHMSVVVVFVIPDRCELLIAKLAAIWFVFRVKPEMDPKVSFL